MTQDIWGISNYHHELFLAVVNGAITEDIDGYMMRDREEIRVGGEKRTLEWLYRQLWNCTDPLPGVTCDVLGLPAGSTYADAVRSELLRVDELGANQVAQASL